MQRFATALLSLAASLAVAVPLSAQNPKAARRELDAALRELDAKQASGERLCAAIAALGAFDDARSAKGLLEAASELAGLRTTLLEQRRKLLLDGGGSGRLKRSRYELQNLDDGREAVAAALRGLRSPAAVREMLQQLTDKGSALPLWLRLELGARAGELPAEQFDWRPQANKKYGDDTLLALLSVMGALGPRVGDDKGLAWLLAQLRHDNPDVRIAAASALARVARPGCIVPLIDRLEAETSLDAGAVREALLDALVVLTGAAPGDAAGSWRAWLAAEGAPFIAGERPLGRGDAKLRDRRATGGTVSGSYFGIPQTGRSILYVFDQSDSMQAKLGGGAKGGGPTTGGAPETRWQLCKQELKNALRGLTPDKRFNLVGFANRVRSYAAEMQPASEANVAAAIAWIDGLKLEFETNVYDALELAFALAGRGVDDRYYACGVDTIFFLSDGAPTLANLDASGIGADDADRVLLAVRRWNALSRVTVHAVGIGLQERKKERDKNGRLWPAIFLQKLAEQNGGQYARASR
ncbi:MAG: hypothetical protein R3F29_10545 [Planctomycetota bacterium]